MLAGRAAGLGSRLLLPNVCSVAGHSARAMIARPRIKSGRYLFTNLSAYSHDLLDLTPRDRAHIRNLLCANSYFLSLRFTSIDFVQLYI